MVKENPKHWPASAIEPKPPEDANPPQPPKVAPKKEEK